MGAVHFALEFLCLYVGLDHTGAARATLLLYGAPFVVALGTQITPALPAALAPIAAGIVLVNRG